MRKILQAGFLAGCAFAGVTHATAAMAQAAQPDDTGAGYGDIIVTAQKRSQSVKDVPATITALSREELATRQVLSINDLTTRVPSFQVGRTYGTNLITLRGISTNATSGYEDPSVAVHVNGVYQARARNLDAALFDLERVEVLSGPQGTLYGRNATGGVVNYILRGPSDQFEGEITGRAANYDRQAIQGSIAGPIGDKVGFRLSAVYDNQGKGFAVNITPGAPKKRFEESKVTAFRGVLRVKPTDTLTIDLDGSYAKNEGSYYVNMLAPPANAGLAALLSPQSFAPHTTSSLQPSFRDSTDYQLSATATLEISPAAELKSITAYQNFKNEMLVDVDSSPLVGVETLQNTRSHTFTQEFNLTTRSFNDRLNSVFGFFYFDDTATVNAVTTIGLTGVTNVQTNDNRQRSKSMAFYTDQTFSVLPSLRLIAGIRYNTDMKRANQYTKFNSAFTCTPRTTKRVDQAWTPRFGIQLDVTPRIMAYATYQEGFKAGGVGANTCANSFAPENIKGGEAGIKAELADRRVRLNLAGYWYNYNNIQVQKTLGVAGFAVLNAAAAKIKGVEASLNVAILDNLHFDAAGMVQSAKYTDFANCNQSEFPGACSASDPRPVPVRTINVRGAWLNRAPDRSLNLGLQYDQRFSGGTVTLRGEAYFAGTTHYNEFATALITQKPYDVENFYLSYEPTDRRFTARAFVKNAFNTTYLVGGFYSASTQQFAGLFAAPRTYGGELTFRF